MLTNEAVREAVARAGSRFADVCAGSTDEQWSFQPVGVGDQAWNVSQVVDHVTAANGDIVRLMGSVVVTSPRGDRALDFDDEDLPYIFYGGGGPAPPGLRAPSPALAKDEALRSSRASAQAILDWYDANTIDLRECAVVHPAFGLFDGAQWLLFAAVHMQQHRGQILDLTIACDKATPEHATL